MPVVRRKQTRRRYGGGGAAAVLLDYWCGGTPPKRLATATTFLLIVIILVVVVAVILISEKNNKLSRQLATNEMFLKDFPSTVPDVWPNDQKDLYMGNVLLSCLPDEEDEDEQEDTTTTTSKCRQHGIPGSTVQRIGILRPPGILGNVMEEFVRNVVAGSSSSTKSKIELIGTSYIERNHTYNKIIRFATLPMLLGTLDLVLGTIDNDDENDSQKQNQITLQDVLGVVRLLVRWHCRLSSIANNSALLTLTTQMIMSHPSGVQKNIELYLGLNKHKKNKNGQGNNSGGRTMMTVEDMLNGHAGKVLHRIDECTTKAMQLVLLLQQQRHRYHLLGSKRQYQHQDLLVLLQDLVDQTIEDELQRGTCGDDESVLWPSSTSPSAGIWAGVLIPKTRVTNIIGSLLLLPDTTTTHGESSSSSAIICQKYPKIPLCSNNKVAAAASITAAAES